MIKNVEEYEPLLQTWNKTVNTWGMYLLRFHAPS